MINSISHYINKLSKRLLFTSITIILLFLLFTFLAYIFYKAEAEIVIIPKDYRGEIFIIFDQKNGDSIQYENKKRIYAIPKTGVKLTQFSWNTGFINREYKLSGSNESIDVISTNYIYSRGNSDSDIVSLFIKSQYFLKNANTDTYLLRADRFIYDKRKNFGSHLNTSKLDSIINLIIKNTD